MTKDAMIIYSDKITIKERLVFIAFLAIILAIFSMAIYKMETTKSYTIGYSGGKHIGNYDVVSEK